MAKSGVSLVAPRPPSARATNEYIETPLPRVHRSAVHQHERSPRSHYQLGADEQRKKKELEELGPVTRTQPKAASGVPLVTPPATPSSDSIICHDCGRCRCASCRSPPQPPSAWLCSDLCYVSPESCVDYATCLCCVRGILYHCSPDEDWSRDPCSCSSTHWLRRWTCLGLTSIFLPCLCCYCPLKTCSDSCTSAYAACSHRGCSCENS
ncbi:Sprouty protein (Spry) [Nesidiocoris tenuis]|uniref:Sprouty protein (Spry) n=1 Tax=Nesidiocoris tenuis TaxID=355587 RepID=A0ABN7BBH8_9HEMI|nr:Sprouty protein (Spry) [Nesidiocoris tenuis]